MSTHFTFQTHNPVIRPKAPYLVKPKVQSPNNQMLMNKIRKKNSIIQKKSKLKIAIERITIKTKIKKVTQRTTTNLLLKGVIEKKNQFTKRTKWSNKKSKDQIEKKLKKNRNEE